jgi:hypothetical protein
MQPGKLRFFRMARLLAYVSHFLDVGAGYGRRLDMICADFLAGANLQDGNPEALFLSVTRLVGMLSRKRQQSILRQVGEAG